jgi:hypothetical protein
MTEGGNWATETRIKLFTTVVLHVETLTRILVPEILQRVRVACLVVRIDFWNDA